MLKIVPKAASNFVSVFFFIHGWLSKPSSGSEAAFGTTFRVPGGYLKVGTSSPKVYWMDFHN
jgi:hypothetical protein